MLNGKNGRGWSFKNCVNAGLALPLVLSACTGQLEGTRSSASSAQSGGDLSNGVQNGAQTATGTQAAPPGTAACSQAAAPGFVGVRRLTRSEYNATASDLLGDTSAPANGFPSEDSVLAEGSHVSTLFFEKHLAAAESMIDATLSRELALGAQPENRVLICPSDTQGVACAQSIVLHFAEQAWRRKVTAEDLAPFLTVFESSQARGESVNQSTRWALVGVFLSPEFLFRIEFDPPGSMASVPRPLAPHELAARLSYFLTGSMPDATLRAQADAGTLVQPSVLEGEAIRLLGGPSAARFSRNFVRYWLALGALDAAAPNPDLFPQFTPGLRQAMADETSGVFGHVLETDGSAADLLDANFSMLNQQLAEHYGLTLPDPQLAPTELRLVPLPEGPRRGLLGQASILTMTSTPSRTNPIRRGKWVLSSLLCSQPPPPPPNIPRLPADPVDTLTERQRFEMHRADPTCAGCHALMDPIGFGLENFDAVGKYRTAYAGGALIDPSGVFPDGRTFQSVVELRALLRGDPRIASCVADSLFKYALERNPTTTDACLVQELTQSQGSSGGQLKQLISKLTQTIAFTERRGEEGAVP